MAPPHEIDGSVAQFIFSVCLVRLLASRGMATAWVVPQVIVSHE